MKQNIKGGKSSHQRRRVERPKRRWTETAFPRLLQLLHIKADMMHGVMWPVKIESNDWMEEEKEYLFPVRCFHWLNGPRTWSQTKGAPWGNCTLRGRMRNWVTLRAWSRVTAFPPGEEPIEETQVSFKTPWSGEADMSHQRSWGRPGTPRRHPVFMGRCSGQVSHRTKLWGRHPWRNRSWWRGVLFQ